MFFAAATATPPPDPAPVTQVINLSAYPQWLVVLVATVVLTLGLWIMMKLLKWTLWILLFVIFIGGLCWSAYLLVEALGWL